MQVQVSALSPNLSVDSDTLGLKLHMGILSRIFGSPARPGRLGEEEGFLDVDVPLTGLKQADGGTHATCRGSFERGVIAAVAVHLDCDWEPQPISDGGAVVYWGKGRLTSAGRESDKLISLLALGYGYNSFSERRMLIEVPFQAVCLKGDPRPQPTANVRMKLFFFPDDEKRYAEVFLSIDCKRQLLEFHEKDNEFRLSLLRALTEA